MFLIQMIIGMNILAVNNKTPEENENCRETLITANSQTPFLLPSTNPYLIPTKGMPISEKEAIVGENATVGINDPPTLNQSKGINLCLYSVHIGVLTIKY